MQQVENMLHKQKALETENQRLQQEILQLKEHQETFELLKESDANYQRAIEALTERLEKILLA